MTGRAVSPKRVAVAGGGIGGLAAAIALADDGHRVDVYEQASQLSEIGAGIQLSPNATRVLDAFGVLDDIAGLAVQPGSGDLRRWQDGSTLVSQALGPTMTERYGYPYLHIHRADLHRALARSATRRCAIHLDHAALSIEGESTLVTSHGRHDVDVIVGADGIHSRIRHELFGAEQPRFSGSCAWRAPSAG